jgi:hypothetical protein
MSRFSIFLPFTREKVENIFCSLFAKFCRRTFRGGLPLTMGLKISIFVYMYRYINKTVAYIFKKPCFLCVLLLASVIYSQGIKFEIPTDESGLPTAPPPKQEPQKLGIASGRPLNLAELSAKDTASFETYKKRQMLVQDSISATYNQIDAVKKKTTSFMPKLEPKSEFEKQAEYDARQSKWNMELGQRIEKDTKSLTQRLAELEKAKAKIQENQASLYGSVDIKSSPPAVSIYLGREEIGATPAEYSLLIPGEAKISLRKEGYNQFDTSLQVTPGAKFKLNVILEEKSIFSSENEIDFNKLLSKDTTVLGYEARIERVKARKTEIDGEIKQILEDFKTSYPPLEPQKAGELPEDFEKRKKAWNNEGMRLFSEFQKKHETYSTKLARSVETLQDYIIATQSTIMTEVAALAKTELGAYDAEKETFELVAQDSSNSKSPFYFSGKVGVPVVVAKELNRTAPGFVIGFQFINYPFEAESENVNLAMSKLQISHNGKELNVQGSFSEIKRYVPMKGYNDWKQHADSLLSGKLKAQGLDYAYAMGRGAAKDAAKKDSEPGDGLGWRGWTRIGTYALAAGLAGAAVFMHLEAGKYADNASKAENQNQFDENENLFNDSVNKKIYCGIGAGVLAIAGTATFFF